MVASVADKPDLLYRADMTTNGYLLDVPTAEKLARLGVTGYQISLDGPEAVHDTTRVRRNGGASFQRIWQNLLAVRDSGLPVRILLRMHLTPKNLPSMPDFVRQVRDTFLDDSRFSVGLKPVERMGGPNDATMETLSRQARAEALRQLDGILKPGPTASNTPAGPAVCYAARPNSLVIRANGSIAKCTVALSDPSNTIGRLAPDGALHVDNARLGPWLRGWSEGAWASVGCPYAGMPRSGRSSCRSAKTRVNRRMPGRCLQSPPENGRAWVGARLERPLGRPEFHERNPGAAMVDLGFAGPSRPAFFGAQNALRQSGAASCYT